MSARVCILGWYGSANVGDEAELAAILTQLATLPQPPHAAVFSTAPPVTQRRFGGYLGGLSALPRAPLGPRTWLALRRSRLLIFGGGGLIQDQTSIYNLPIFTLFGLLARLLGVPLMWWGVGVEPLVTGFGRWQARKLVALCAPGAASVRDDESFNILREAGVPAASLRVTADPALTLPPACSLPDDLIAATNANRSGPLIIFSLRDLPNNPKGRGAAYLLPMALQKRLGLAGGDSVAHEQQVATFYRTLAQVADELIRRHAARILFLPFWAGRDDTIAEKCVTVMQYGAQTESISRYVEPRTARALIGRADLVVSVRLHPLIFATAAGVPAIGFTYARKIRGFLTRAGAANCAFDPATTAATALLREIERLLADSTVSSAVDGLKRLAGEDLRVCAGLLAD